MCRYAAYLGPPLALSHLIYKPPNSLVHQAKDAMQSSTRINADGFGVGWYAHEIGPAPAVFKDTRPMWNNRNLGSIAGKIRSRCIVAHVRSAKSYDPVTHENCHPFQRERLLWMHNGDIPGRARLSRQVSIAADDTLLAQLRGNTDTEMAFTLFLTNLPGWPEAEPELEQLAAALETTLGQIAGWHAEAGETRPVEMNFCVTDGTVLAASRFAVSDEPCPTLHWYESGQGESRTVCVASEPLFPDGEWHALANGELLMVDRELRVTRREVGALDRLV